jgi:serine/threonine protein kinase
MALPSVQEPSVDDVVRPGEVVAGKFVVESVIGVGGMGVVVLATHSQLEERVALKFLRRDVVTRPDVVQRFSQEARAAAKLKSEHVARVIDVGTHNGLPFMVMEYLEGIDVRGYIDRGGPVDLTDACEFLIQACEGLGEAHARGIVHRDIKPENLFVTDRAGERTIKLLDFGISKMALTGRSTNIDTHGPTQGLMGSPFYMSPEQLRSTKDVDRRADIWSLGAVFFEMLTGETAFSDTEEFTELVAEILEKPHRRASQLRKGLPPKLEQIIDRCLAKNREERYQSTGELALDLAPFVRSRARATASKAVAIANSAGFSKNLQVLDSMPPPSISDVPLTIQQKAASAASKMPTSPEGALAVTTSAASPSRFKLWMLAPVVLLFLGGALLWGAKSGAGDTAVAAPSTSVAVTAAFAAQPGPTVQASNPPAIAETQAPVVVAANHDATPKATPRGHLPVPPAGAGAAAKHVTTVAPVVTATAVPVPVNSLEIRRER